MVNEFRYCKNKKIRKYLLKFQGVFHAYHPYNLGE